MRKDRGLNGPLLRLLSSPALFRLLRDHLPIFRFPPLDALIVTRFDDVEEVLRHDQIFHVLGDRIIDANGRLNFLLGMQDGACPHRRGKHDPPSYRDYQRMVMQSMPLEDLRCLGAKIERESERVLYEAAQPRAADLDAIRQLVTHIPLMVCREYYGVAVDDALDTFQISGWLFHPEKTPENAARGRAASERLNASIERAIDAVRENRCDTVLSRLISAGTDREVTRAILFGLIVGFVPTNTMAAGHMLEVLLANPAFLKTTRAAALSRDDERLKRCLFEAMRFMPLLREPLRVCARDYTLAEGQPHARRVLRGQRVIALTACAMRDERRVREPERFDPDRPAHHSLVFGQGLHRCIGAPLAEVQITHMFRPLLRRRNLRRAPGERGELQRLGPFPEHLHVCFDA